MSVNPQLVRLLEHPGIWRGTSVARTQVLPSGCAALDERLPGRGWPRSGLIEVLVSRVGVGELTLLLPVLAHLTSRPEARWCVWVCPPFEPYAPALLARGVVLERLLVTRPQGPPAALWAFEQSLGSGACDAVLAWTRRPAARQVRRLQLAAERGRTLGVLFRPRTAARESSHATLRLVVEPAMHGVRVTLLKSKGGIRGSVDIDWRTSGS